MPVDTAPTVVREIVDAAVSAEREACAKICDSYDEQATFMAANDIRGRGFSATAQATGSVADDERTYHDVEVEFDGRRIRLFDASYGLRLTCTRAGGWGLWNASGGKDELLAGEYNEIPLRVYVAGILICGGGGPATA